MKRLGLVASLALAVAMAPGCAQDPYKIPNTGDANGTGDGADLSIDLPPPDIYRPDKGPDINLADLSYDACIAQTEACNNADDNCNGQIDEGYDKLNDARYCDNCKGCQNLQAMHAVPACQNGKCVVSSCIAGYYDVDKKASNGCEYKCTPTGAAEICDGLDNDCNGKTDEGVTLSINICKTLGACAGATAVCKGTDGWVCQYGPDVELQPCTTDNDCGNGQKCDTSKGVCPNVVRVDEQKCDGKDGDCDGQADDPWNSPGLSTKLGDECDLTKACPNGNSDCDTAGGSTCVNGTCTPKKGRCRDVGQYVCKADRTGVECKLKTAGAAPTAETCNGIDDNCNGAIDDNVTDEAWVSVGNFKIFKYEASRPDGTAATAGIQSAGRPCSVPNRLPWANVTRTEANQACQRAGGKLCTVAQWQQACRGSSNTNYPYGNTFDGSKCNGRAYDPNKDAPLVTQLPASCVSPWPAGSGGGILDMSGNVKEWVATGFSGNNPTGYELKGGAFDTPSLPTAGAGLSCNYQLPAPASSLQLPTIGFRCCK